jgi:hypothetical protein
MFARQRCPPQHRQLWFENRQFDVHPRLVIAPPNPSVAQVRLNCSPSHCSSPLTTPSPHLPPPQAATSNVQSEAQASPAAS